MISKATTLEKKLVRNQLLMDLKRLQGKLYHGLFLKLIHGRKAFT